MTNMPHRAIVRNTISGSGNGYVAQLSDASDPNNIQMMTNVFDLPLNPYFKSPTISRYLVEGSTLLSRKLTVTVPADSHSKCSSTIPRSALIYSALPPVCTLPPPPPPHPPPRSSMALQISSWA